MTNHTPIGKSLYRTLRAKGGLALSWPLTVLILILILIFRVRDKQFSWCGHSLFVVRHYRPVLLVLLWDLMLVFFSPYFSLLNSCLQVSLLPLPKLRQQIFCRKMSPPVTWCQPVSPPVTFKNPIEPSSKKPVLKSRHEKK
jgi:hypothetical protein